MVYLLKIVIFHGYVSHNQMVSMTIRWFPSQLRLKKCRAAWNTYCWLEAIARVTTFFRMTYDWFCWEQPCFFPMNYDGVLYMFPYNNPMVLRNASNQSSFGQHRPPPSGWLMLGRCLDLEFSNSVEIQLVIKPLVNGWFEYVLIYVFMGSSFWTTNSSQR